MIQFLRIASRSAVLTLVAALITCVTQSAMAATTAARGDIVVVTVHGTVNATMAGMTTVRTGADGAVELRQGSSTFAAAGNTELEIPQSAAEDGLVERIVQIRGNAFYSIGKRTGTRLRVEAPYLVAVIKGTQFNVAAQEDSTTIALFEGHLEVRASDESDVVNLDAGEIAIRRRDDVSITVLRLNAAARDARRNQELAARPQADSPRSTPDAVAARNDDTASRPRVDTTLPTDGATRGDDLGATRGDDLSVTSPTERERIVDALPDSTEVAAKTALAVDLPAGSVDLNTGVTAAAGEVARIDTGVSAGVDLGSGTATAAADVGVNVGTVSADVGAGANVDIPAGAASVDVGASAAVGEVASVDTTVSTAVDASAGTVDVGADTSVAGTDVGANVGSGGLEVDLGLGGLLGRKHRN